ncbi:helix-turn-helix domain-containing protein [Amycolatopsis cihanbeyliensis]|uniref:Helix-turn-helix protein n=1 Tax=Amycolatopsis cihanbeyliensis TaxID=1128664 RepID=A0A542DFN7_AMYCI|nr:helix-turn-helix transcriptional regulator [Amycolatopsis cihanbeyliensis]TQJ01895.1 helix-turn-helix protein [Amycolatopsis cihanbeyliensis]
MGSSSPTVRKRQLGLALADRRQQAGKTREDAAAALECSLSKISRIEHGDVGVRPIELRELLDLYGVGKDERGRVEELARLARQRRPRTTYGSAIPDWFRKFVNLEEVASEIRTYDSELVTGLLQTGDYARALIEATPLHRPEEIDRVLAAREARQRLITGDEPIRVWAVMSEGAVRRVVGGREVMAAQLEYLAELGRQPHITIQVVPFGAGAHPSTGFNFSLLRFPDDDGADIAYLEHLTGASYLDRDRPQEMKIYEITFNALSAAALPPADSLRLLDNVRQEL